MKKLRYICVQPKTLYYAWQVEVMINNFISNGINPNDIDILVAYNPNDSTSSEENVSIWNKLVNGYKNVNFYFYEDLRERPIHYISSIRPNILKQHFKKYPELSNEVFFYHDCDICFTKPVDFSHLLEDDIWYVSDTNSYINYDYIESKGYGIYDIMCNIVGIDRNIPIQNNNDSGGAQYILKNITYEYWNKVENDAESLYTEVKQLNMLLKKKNSNYHELQIWCADMWSVLWNGWVFTNEIKIIKDLDFCWATDPIQRWNEAPMFHNAGVVSSGNGFFYKAAYRNELPYYANIENYNKEYCSFNYVNEIIKTSKVSCLK